MKNFFRVMSGCACLVVAVAIPIGARAAPAAPTVVISAPQVKQLGFKWNYVPQANYYELWFKANSGATEVKFDDLPSWHPRATNEISAHLLDWNEARYRVKACNPSGCTATAPLSVKAALPSTLGLLKSTFPLDYSGFGNASAVSEDGQTLVVAATDESNDRNIQYPVAYLYVYRRVQGKWLPDARIFPDRSNIGDGPGLVLSVDAAGDRFVVGLPTYISNAGAQGEVLVYHRTSSGWVAELQVLPDAENDGVGYTVGIDGKGETLIFGRGFGNGSVDLYRRSGTTWSPNGTLSGVTPSAGCNLAAISSDASTIVRTCDKSGNTPAYEVFAAPYFTLQNHYPVDLPAGGYTFGALAVDATGSTLAFSIVKPIDTRQSSPQIAVYRRGTNSYTRAATLTPGAWRSDTQFAGTEFGHSIALSSDGTFLAAGDGSDNGQGQGVFSTALQPGGRALGAVYVFQNPAGTWRLRRVVKPNYQPGRFEGTISGFGRSVAFGRNGKTLAVGHPGESTFVANPDNFQTEPTGTESGAVWLY